MKLKGKSDPRRTAKYRLIELHYANFADELRWTSHRFRRLASVLQFTEHELGALIGLKIFETETYLKHDLLPRPESLHLCLIERSIYPTSKPPLFPEL